MINTKGIKMAKVHVERLTDDCIYVKVGDMTVYVDDSTEEQIISISSSSGDRIKSEWHKPSGETGSLQVFKRG